MKKLRKLIFYLFFFIIGFLIPILLTYYIKDKTISFSHSKEPSSSLEKTQNFFPKDNNISSDEIPLSTNQSLLLLDPRKISSKIIEKECNQKYSFYNNKTRYEWAQMLIISILEKKIQKEVMLEVDVDNSLWDNIDLQDKKMIVTDIFSCYPRRSYMKIRGLFIIDASNGETIGQFNPKSGWKFSSSMTPHFN